MWKRLRAAGLSGSLILASVLNFARADQLQFSNDDRRILQEVAASINHSHSMPEVLAALKENLSGAQYKFLSQKIANETAPAPHVSLTGEDGATVTQGDLRAQIRFLSVKEGLLAINGRTVDLGTGSDLEEQWNKVLAAIPPASDALWNFVLPEAQAQPVAAAGVVSVAIAGILTVWYIVSGDPCDGLKEPLNNCTDAIRKFKELKTLHLKWPWKGKDSERQSQLKVDGLGLAGYGKALKKAPCDDNDGDCKMRWHDIMAGKCTPPWASDAVDAGMTAFNGSTPAMGVHGMGLRKSLVFDNPMTRNVPVISALRCNTYPALQSCLKELAGDLHAVCVHPEDSVTDYYKSLGRKPPRPELQDAIGR